MKSRLYGWIVRQWRQNVIGISPLPEYTTWQALATAVGWDEEEDSTERERKLARLIREFDDETALMFETFKKLMGTLTAAGIVFAIAGGWLFVTHSSLTSTLVFLVLVAIIFVIWGLSTRFKVMKKTKDSSIAALVVRDEIGGKGVPVRNQQEADVWYYYLWKWHRHCTRLAIDRLFLIACVLLAIAMATIGLMSFVF